MNEPEAKGRRAALYVRVSSDQQHLGNQKPDLRRLAATRGFNVTSIFEEKMSAVKTRPEFDKMMLAAHEGKFDVVVVWALDRLGRSMVGNLQTVLELDRRGVEVVSVREPWLDTTSTSPVRALLVAIFSWVAEQERVHIVARCRAGIERARREGKRLGRPPAEVDLDEALRLRRRGLSIRDAARKLAVGSSTLHRAIQAHDRERLGDQKAVSQ
jgi:DNA invertase Pin-like site-specific DNA recombinase